MVLLWRTNKILVIHSFVKVSHSLKKREKALVDSRKTQTYRAITRKLKVEKNRKVGSSTQR